MNLSYRPDIDGLRALAVLSVILYHAQIVIFGHDFFSGGFVGVDIFFVISGYLISRILGSELFKQGRIDFFGFYERRARRILPVLFIVFLFSFPFAYKLLLPGQFIEYSQSILSAIFFGSNIFFYLTNTQYGAEDSLLQPFLHTWSLGVEEQFYILFPILLLLIYKFAQRYLIFIILILILISLQYANWQSSKSIQFNFYMLASRFWELGFGSLLAFYELKYGKVKHEFLNSIMPLLGFLLIIYSIVFFNSQIPHPSFITLIPTLGTALIIIFSVNQSDLISKLLNLKPVVGIGLISYSMYLWHYPVFAFARSASINALDSIEKALLITLTIILSIISYKFIEKPFRNRQFLSLKKFILIILGMVFSIFILNIFAINQNIFNSNYKLSENYNFDKKDLIAKVTSNLGDSESNFIDGKKRVLILGNSHSQDFYLAMHLNKNIVSNYSFRIVGFKKGIENNLGGRLFLKNKLNKKNQFEINEDFFGSANYLNSELIILSAVIDSQKINLLGNLLKKITDDQKKIILLSNKQMFNFKTGKGDVVDKLIKNNPDLSSDKINYLSFKYRTNFDNINDDLKFLADKFNLQYFDTQKSVCNEEKEYCDVVQDNFVPLYRDNGHWTVEGAKLFGKRILEDGFLEVLDGMFISN